MFSCVDEMGKNISGSGMDTISSAAIMFIGEKEPERPRITRIVVLDLTPECQRQRRRRRSGLTTLRGVWSTR